MMKTLLAGVAGVAMVGFAGSAMAQTDTFDVNVNINVAETVSFWPDHNSVNLVLDGGAENSDAFQSGLNHINNTTADITVEVGGTLPPPIPSGPQAGNPQVNFFIFDEVTAPDALDAIVDNANNPAGALVFTATGGAPQTLASVAVANDIDSRILTYAASAPNWLPNPDDFAVVVTFTMTGT